MMITDRGEINTNKASINTWSQEWTHSTAPDPDFRQPAYSSDHMLCYEKQVMLCSFDKKRKLIKGWGEATSFDKQYNAVVSSMNSGVRLQFESQLACYKLCDNLKCISVAHLVPLPLAAVVSIKWEYMGCDKHSAWHAASIKSNYFNLHCYYYYHCDYCH